LKNNADDYRELAKNGKNASREYSRDIQAQSAMKILKISVGNRR